MARPRKAQKFAEVFNGLDTDDLKLMKKEVSTEIKIREKRVDRTRSAESAKKLRDRIRIGNVVNFSQRIGGGPILQAEVVGIFTDKVQVVIDGRKRSISIVKIKSVES